MKIQSIFHLLFLTSAVSLFGVLPLSAESRTFTNQKGKKIQAEITAVVGKKVTLRMSNGKKYTIPIKTLSLIDQVYVDEWEKEGKKSDAGKSGGSTLVIPDNVKYRFEFEADKKRLSRGKKSKVGSGEVQTDHWGYEVSLKNKSRAKLEGLEMSYRIYVEPNASKKIGLGDPPKLYGGRMKVKAVADQASVVVTTNQVPIKELELDPDYVFNDGSRNDLEDKVEGIWIKLWHGDKKVGEFKSNKSTVKKAEWADNETADPNAEPEEPDDKKEAPTEKE